MDDLNTELEKLIKKIDELFFNDNLEEIEETLTEELLDEHNSDVLSAYYILNFNELNGFSGQEEIERCLELENILDWQRVMLKGFLEILNKNYIQSIKHFEKCYSIISKQKFRFYVGCCRLFNREFIEAISIFSDCIDKKINSRSIFWYRAKAYYSLNEMKMAISDFAHFNSIRANHPDGYLGLGNCYDALEDWKNAIKYYNKTIKLDDSKIVAYVSKAMIYDRQGNLTMALRTLEKANAKSELKGKNHVYLTLLGLVLKNKVNYRVALFKVIDFFMNIVTIMRPYGISNPSGNHVLDIVIKEILPSIVRFRELAMDTSDIWPNSNSSESERLVSHYTNLQVADKLVMTEDIMEGDNSASTKDRLRYSNTAFLNDPQEGRVLFDYFKDSSISSDKEWEEIRNLFDKGLIINSNFYIGSFLPVDSSHEDDLVMWRTYGKDHLYNEAAGCNLIIDANFFDKHTKSPNPIQMQVRKDVIDYSQFEVGLNQPLFRVFYYNRTSKRFFNVSTAQMSHEDLENELKKINEKDDAIKKCLEEIGHAIIEIKRIKIRDKKGKLLNKDINNSLIQYILSELRFFFKSADYSYENELRVIINGIGRNIEISDDKLLPRKTYVESKRAIRPFLRKIILGPKVSHPDRWIYLDTKMKRDYPKNSFELIKSKCNFQ